MTTVETGVLPSVGEGQHDVDPAEHAPVSPKARRAFIRNVAVMAAIGGMLFGYDTGVISGALLYIKPAFHLDAAAEGLVTSILLIGAALGAVLGGRVADALGRRMALIVAGIVFIVGTAGSALALDYGVLIGSRAVLGIAVGIASIIVPLYISEMAPSSVRGRLVSLNTLMIVTGQLVAYIVNALLAPSGAWRWMLGIAAVPAIVLVLGMLFLPDTPAWYQRKGRDEKALAVLRRGHSAEASRKELAAIRLGREAESASSKGIRGLSEWWITRTLLICIGIAILQQITGVNTVIYFAPTLLVQSGLSSGVAVLSSISIGIVSVAATIIGLRLVDKVKRRRLLIGGSAGGVLSLIALGIMYPYSKDSTALAFVTLGLMVVFLAFQQAAVATTTWLIISELVPAQIRGLGMGIAGLFLWLTNFAVSLAFLPVVAKVGGGITFIGFAVIGVLGILFVFKFVPETRGASLQDIETHMRVDAPTGAIEIVSHAASEADAAKRLEAADADASRRVPRRER
ncbi:sugar porter family MFS transporter [Frondihabitans cladoniiphilus]